MPGESQQAPSTAPDPTVLTTEQLLREVENAVKLLHAEMEGLKSVVAEQFSSVGTQFQLIERQRVEQKADTEKAVQAALSAAKEAVKEQTTAFALATDKSERAMTEQLKQLTATFTTAIKGTDDTVSDTKDRVGKLESLKQGAQESRTATSAGANLLVGLLGLLVAALVLGVAIYAATH